MKFSTSFPELNPGQIKLLVSLIEDVIGKDDPVNGEPDMDMRLANMIRNDLRSDQHEVLHELISKG